jgi:hypothetical protein
MKINSKGHRIPRGITSFVRMGMWLRSTLLRKPNLTLANPTKLPLYGSYTWMPSRLL